MEKGVHDEYNILQQMSRLIFRNGKPYMFVFEMFVVSHDSSMDSEIKKGVHWANLSVPLNKYGELLGYLQQNKKPVIKKNLGDGDTSFQIVEIEGKNYHLIFSDEYLKFREELCSTH